MFEDKTLQIQVAISLYLLQVLENAKKEEVISVCTKGLQTNRIHTSCKSKVFYLWSRNTECPFRRRVIWFQDLFPSSAWCTECPRRSGGCELHIPFIQNTVFVPPCHSWVLPFPHFRNDSAPTQSCPDTHTLSAMFRGGEWVGGWGKHGKKRPNFVYITEIRVTPRAFDLWVHQVCVQQRCSWSFVSNMHERCTCTCVCVYIYIIIGFSWISPRFKAAKRNSWVWAPATLSVGLSVSLCVHTNLNHWKQLEASWVTWEKGCFLLLARQWRSGKSGRAGGWGCASEPASLMSHQHGGSVY